MSRVSILNSPFLLGFDHVERTLDRLAKTAGEGYPPYNIEQVAEGELRITLAVAGFGRDDLSIQLENDQLSIRGRQQDDGSRVYLHRGIAARQFQRSFVLAEGIEVTGAALDNGLLHIDLKRPVPQARVKTIEITTSKTAGAERLSTDGAASARMVDVETGTRR